MTYTHYIPIYTHSFPLPYKFENIEFIFNDKAQYVSDVIGTDWLYKWTPNVPVFISAQTGRGKNFFIQNTIVPEILKHNRRCNDNKKILILSNRIALNHQNKIELAKIIDIYSNKDISYENILQKRTDEQINSFTDFGDVKVSSYHQLLNNNLLDNDYAFVIIDECHFFTQDSLFNADTSKILDAIINKCKDSIRIYTSATLDDILPIILEKDISKKFEDSPYKRAFLNPPILGYENYILENTISKNILPFCRNFDIQSMPGIDYFVYFFKFYDNQHNEITPYYTNKAVIYDLEPNYTYIKTHLMKNSNDALLEEISRTHSKDSKWIIFVKSKKEGKTLNDQLNKKQISSEFISSESKTEVNTAYQQIIKECKFDVEVLISTAVIDNGVNIKDAAVKNIAISIFDYTSFIQMLGRVRPTKGQEINLYLFNFPTDKIEQSINKKYNELLEYLYFDTLSSNEQFEYYQNRLISGAGKGGFNCDSKTRKPYYSEAAIDKLLNTIYSITPFIKNLDPTFKLKASNPRQKNKLIGILEDKAYKSSQKRLSASDKKRFLVLKDDISPEKLELYIEPSIINDDYIKKIFYTIYTYEQNDELTVRQYFYLNRIKFFINRLFNLTKRLNDVYTNSSLEHELDKLTTCKKNLISKIKKYVRLFNHNNLSFDYKNIPYSPIIYHQLLWLEKFNLDVEPSTENTPITKETLIKLLEDNSVSKDEYDEAINSNSNLNNLLQDKGFLAKDKDNTDIYCKIQEYISSNSAKKDCKSASKINEFFKENSIPFEIQSQNLSIGKKETYWLITKLNS